MNEQSSRRTSLAQIEPSLFLSNDWNVSRNWARLIVESVIVCWAFSIEKQIDLVSGKNTATAFSPSSSFTFWHNVAVCPLRMDRSTLRVCAYMYRVKSSRVWQLSGRKKTNSSNWFVAFPRRRRRRCRHPTCLCQRVSQRKTIGRSNWSRIRTRLFSEENNATAKIFLLFQPHAYLRDIESRNKNVEYGVKEYLSLSREGLCFLSRARDNSPCFIFDWRHWGDAMITVSCETKWTTNFIREKIMHQRGEVQPSIVIGSVLYHWKHLLLIYHVVLVRERERERCYCCRQAVRPGHPGFLPSQNRRRVRIIAYIE